MRWNTPLSEAHAAVLLECLDLPGVASVVDFGCGWGELLIRAIETDPTGRWIGLGLDVDQHQIERANAAAHQRRVDDRVHFRCTPAESWTEPTERALCLGAAHAWGGTAPALGALRKLTLPGGRLLFGDGCWDAQPTAAAARIFPDVPSLEQLVAEGLAAGWRVLHLDTADQREWDEFESSWRRGRERWLGANADAVAASRVRAELDERVTEYVRDYRGVLGFCYLVLEAA